MRKFIQVLKQICMNPYFSAIGLFLIALIWFVDFAFFDRKIIDILFGGLMVLFALSFLVQARRPK